MTTHTRHRLLATIALGTILAAGTAQAADYVSIVQEVSVDQPASVVWKKIGGFSSIGTWMHVECEYASGNGDVGSVRRFPKNGNIEEVMVGKTAHSYTYTFPVSDNLYHGTMNVEANGPKKSKIIYTTFYDQEPLKTAEAKTKDREDRTKMFSAILGAAKAYAEAK